MAVGSTRLFTDDTYDTYIYIYKMKNKAAQQIIQHYVPPRGLVVFGMTHCTPCRRLNQKLQDDIPQYMFVYMDKGVPKKHIKRFRRAISLLYGHNTFPMVFMNGALQGGSEYFEMRGKTSVCIGDVCHL